METHVKFDKQSYASLLTRLKASAKKAPSAMKTAMRRSTKAFNVDLKATAPMKTGATKRSIGAVSRRDGVMVGVRPKFVDKKTGKRPMLYAAKINNLRGNWFGKAWDKHKKLVPTQIFKELDKNLLKKGF